MNNRKSVTSPDTSGDLFCEQYIASEAPQKGDLASSAAWRRLLPGVTATLVAALAAGWMSDHHGPPLMLMGLLIGLALNFLNTDERLQPGLVFVSGTLLRWGIVLIGVQITIGQILGLGWPMFVAIALITASVMGIGTFTARKLGLGSAYGVLAGGAVAICGASAALALAALLGERRVGQAQLTLVLVAVSAASAIAMTVYPMLSALMRLNDLAGGFMLGASIHDVAQALAAGYSVSDGTGEIAVIVKLTRVVLLAPMLILVSFFFAEGGERRRWAPDVPWFIIGFFIVVLVNSVVVLPPIATHSFRSAASGLLLMGVVATGIRSPMGLLLAQGWRASLPVIVSTVAMLGLALLAMWLLALNGRSSVAPPSVDGGMKVGQWAAQSRAG